MGLSGSQGFYGVATQGPSNANMITSPAEGAYMYFEATSAPFQPQDVARPRLPTIGAAPLPRNVYKVGTSVASQLGFEATTHAFAKMLYLLLGRADAPVADGNSWMHNIRMNPNNQYEAPYFAARRGVGTQIMDQATGCKLSTAQIDFQAGAAVMATFGLNGRVPGALTTYPAAEPAIWVLTFDADSTAGNFTLLDANVGATAAITFNADITVLAASIKTALDTLYGVADTVGTAGVGEAVTITYADDGYRALSYVAGTLDGDAPVLTATEAGSGGILYDDSPILTVVSETADMQIETSTGVYEGSADGIISLGARLTFGNQLSDPSRYRIGSPYPIDWTLLDRAGAVELSMEIDDPALFRKVYYNGGAMWDPTPWVGGWKLKSTSALKPFTDAGAVARPWSVEVTANTLHYNAFLIANEPQRIVTAVLQAQLLKSNTDGQEPLQFAIRSDRPIAYN